MKRSIVFIIVFVILYIFSNRPMEAVVASPEKVENKHAVTKAKGYLLYEKIREKQRREAKEAKDDSQTIDFLGYQQSLRHESPRHS